MPSEPIRSQAIADTEWVLAWLRNDEDLLIAASVLATIVGRIRGKKPRG